MADDPGGDDAANLSPEVLQQLVEDLRGKLEQACPNGWSHAVDGSGYSYFLQDGTGETSWDFPPVPPPGGEGGDGDARVSALEAQISRMQKQAKKAEAEQKKVALREAAMKTDISKMKAETRQAKKEAGDATREAENKAALAVEEAARSQMGLEEISQRLLNERASMLQNTVRAIRERDPSLAEECLRTVRLGEMPEVPEAINTGVQEAIEEYIAHEELVAQLRTQIRDLESELAFEKQERQRENEEWKEIVRQRDEEIQDLQNTVAERDAYIEELRSYISEADERHRAELERARTEDKNKIVSLQSQLILVKEQYEETMLELANIWPDGVPPPSLLRKYVLPIRQREALERQAKAQEKIRIGSHVQAWNEYYACYQRAVVTAMDEVADHVEVRWVDELDRPPEWLSLSYCMAIVEEDLYKQKEIGTQTDLSRYDEMLHRPVKPKRPRSAVGRMNGRMEAADRRATQALREKRGQSVDTSQDESIRIASENLFRIIDAKNQGEILLVDVWKSILESTQARNFIENNELMHPLRRKEYLVLAWKETDADHDLSIPFDIEEFTRVCVEVYRMSIRPPEVRQTQDATAIVNAEIAAAIQRYKMANAEDSDSSAETSSDEDYGSRSEASVEEADGPQSQIDEATTDHQDQDQRSVLDSENDVMDSANQDANQNVNSDLHDSVEEERELEDVVNENEDGEKDNEDDQDGEDDEDGEDGEESEESEESEETDAEDDDEDPSVLNLRKLKDSTRHDLVQPYLKSAQKDRYEQLLRTEETRQDLWDQIQALCLKEEDEVREFFDRATEVLQVAEEKHAESIQQHDAAVHGFDETLDFIQGKFTSVDTKASLTSKVVSRVWNEFLVGDAKHQLEPKKNTENEPMSETILKENKTEDTSPYHADVNIIDVTQKEEKTSAGEETEEKQQGEILHNTTEEVSHNEQRGQTSRTSNGSILFPEQELFIQSSSSEVAPLSKSRVPMLRKRKINWELLHSHIEKQRQGLLQIENNSKQVVAKKTTEYELQSKRIEDIAKEKASVERERDASENDNIKQGLISKIEIIETRLTQAKAHLGPLAGQREEAETEYSRVVEAKQDFETSVVELETLFEDLQNWENELNIKANLITQYAEAERVARLRYQFWVEETQLLDARSKQQNEVFGAMNEVKAKLDKETESNTQALLRNVEHQEVLKARFIFAQTQMNLAENELDMSVAQNHLIYMSRELSQGMEWAKQQWTQEIQLIDQNLEERARHLQDDCFRLRAALDAVAERAALRRLVVTDMENDLLKQTQYTEASPSRKIESQVGIDQLHALRDLSQQREEAWISESVRIVRGLAGTWIAGQEKSRLQSEIDLTLQETKHKTAQYAEIAMTAQKRYDIMEKRVLAIERRFKAREDAFVAELDTLAKTSEKSIDLLHAELDEQKKRNDEIERISIEHLKMTEEDYLAMRVQLEAKIANLEEILVTNRHWVNTLRTQLQELREQMRIFEEERAREERRLAAEKDQLRQELEAMTQHGARLDNWVNSLKNEVSMLQDTVAFNEQESKRVAEIHKRELRWVRWETWKRDETARTLSTNVDACFQFFIETVARLAGSSRHYNQRIAANAGIQVLHALVESNRPEIARLALEALSAAAWDGHVDFRAISRQATESWRKWVQGISVVTTLRWNRKHRGDTNSDVRDHGDETSEIELPVQGTTVRLAENGRVVEVVPFSVAEKDCGMNLPNQRRIGDGLLGRVSGVDVLIRHLENADSIIVEKVTSTLAVLALEVENRERIGRALPQLLRLVTAGYNFLEENTEPKDALSGSVVKSSNAPETDERQGRNTEDQIVMFQPAVTSNTQEALEADETRRYALSTICNLLYEHEENQEKFAQLYGIRPLLYLCRKTTNVDLLETITLALLNATSICVRTAEQLSEDDGLEILTKLCALPEVAVADGDVAERIQTNIVQTLINATRDLGKLDVSRVARQKIVVFGVEPLVHLMLASSNEVQTFAACIFSNLAQDDAMREQMGQDGAVETLFTLCESEHTQVRTSALNALSNLAWNAANQNRIGKLLPQLINLCLDEHASVRESASGVLANALFYHEGNRRRFGLYTKAVRTCAKLLADQTQTSKVYENIARALGTAAYNDAVAMQAGLLGVIPSLLALCAGSQANVQRTAAFALVNLSVHDIHKTVIIRHDGVEIITALCASDCSETRRHANRILETMADMSRAEELEARRERFGLQGLVALLCGEEQYEGQAQLLQGLSSLQVLACEQLAAESISSESKRRELVKHKGHIALINLLKTATQQTLIVDALTLQVAQRSLWTLRILIQEGGGFYQDLCGTHGLTEAVLGVLDAFIDHVKGTTASEDNNTGLETKLVSARDVCEGAVSTLFMFVFQHERNSRRVLQSGLKVLINIAENFKETDPLSELTRRLLRIMGPYSWIRCVNCSSKQKGGQTCSACGRKLINVFVD